MEFEIFFDDLKRDVQRTLLDYAGVNSPKEMNWDIYPIATIDLEDDVD